MKKVVLLLCLLMVIIISAQFIFAQNANDLKAEVYSKLKCCACQLSFDICVCPEAKEMKAYVDALLENGLPKEKIFYRVAKKFSLKVLLDESTRSEVEERLIKEAGEQRPQLILEPVSFNFGKVSKKQAKIQKMFKLYNKGNAKLVITNIKVSCACASASLKVNKNKSPYFGIAGAPNNWQMAIEPNEFGELEIVLDPRHQSIRIGHLVRVVSIFSNDPLYPEVEVKVEADITS